MKLTTNLDDSATPFQRFENLAKKLIAVPKNETKQAAHTTQRKRRKVQRYNDTRKTLEPV